MKQAILFLGTLLGICAFMLLWQLILAVICVFAGLTVFCFCLFVGLLLLKPKFEKAKVKS